MVSAPLISAYRHWRSMVRNARHWQRSSPNTATDAIKQARADIAAKTPRYAMAPAIYPAISWQTDKPGLGHVENPQRAGLRLVGAVDLESHHDGPWARNEGESGYYTDPNGDTFRDGTGLCWGVVYQLPGHKGQSRYVPGFVFGGTDGGPTLDFSTIYTEPKGGDYWNVDPCEHDAARTAARVANSMAEHAASEERDYQTAWQAGNVYREELDSAEAYKGELKALLGERRAMKSRLADWPAPVLCRTIESAARGLIHDISRAKAKAIKAARGDLEGLMFYPDAKAKDAFCDAADLTPEQFDAIA